MNIHIYRLAFAFVAKCMANKLRQITLVVSAQCEGCGRKWQCRPFAMKWAKVQKCAFSLIELGNALRKWYCGKNYIYRWSNSVYNLLSSFIGRAFAISGELLAVSAVCLGGAVFKCDKGQVGTNDCAWYFVDFEVPLIKFERRFRQICMQSTDRGRRGVAVLSCCGLMFIWK